MMFGAGAGLMTLGKPTSTTIAQDVDILAVLADALGKRIVLEDK